MFRDKKKHPIIRVLFLSVVFSYFRTSNFRVTVPVLVSIFSV
jgi:hypothetical protein